MPMYGVIAAAAVVAGWRMLRGAPDPVRLGWVGWAAAALILFSAFRCCGRSTGMKGRSRCCSSTSRSGSCWHAWAGSRPARATSRWRSGCRSRWPSLFTAVAFFQEATHHLFWNPKVIVANEYAAFFRVNSLFWDSSIYGRFLALTLVLLAGVCAYRRMAWQVLAVMAVLFVGLYFAYSQSSLLALAAGIAAAGNRHLVATRDHRAGRGLPWSSASRRSPSLCTATARRASPATARHCSPTARASSGTTRWTAPASAGLPGRRWPGRSTPTGWRCAASHTTPMTVIAEIGPIGLLLYIALLVAVAAAALHGPGPPAVRLTLAAAFGALFVASLFYNAFFEDPACWILMALIATLPAQTVPLREAPA